MEEKEEKREKVTIKEVLKEYELASLGLTISVDGTPVDIFNKTMDFYRDSGMRERTEYRAIQDMYSKKIWDKTLDRETRMAYGKKLREEISAFKISFFEEKFREYQEGLKKEK